MEDRSFGPRGAAFALIAGGLLTVVLFVPFTLAHGPTSYNEQRVVLGADMHRWGFALGTLPVAAIAYGLWVLRSRFAGPSRVAAGALTVTVAALGVSVLQDLLFRALGPPLALFVLAPGLALAAVTARGSCRLALAALAVVTWAGVGVALIPASTSDELGGYRIFGVLVYVMGGLLWTALGACALRHQKPRQPAPY